MPIPQRMGQNSNAKATEHTNKRHFFMLCYAKIYFKYNALIKLLKRKFY